MRIHSPSAKGGIPGPNSVSLVDHFRTVFAERPDERTFRFLVDGQGEPIGDTNAGTDRRIRALAAVLQQRVAPGERALILCPAGLDYVAAFFACLYAGVTAVPVYPPDPAFLKRTLPRLVGIIEDARPTVVLAPASLVAEADRFAASAPALGRLAWITVDEVDGTAADSWRHPDITGDDLAFLQYTSGSTSRPKGVMVGHGNLLHNLDGQNRRLYAAGPDDHMVTWLPPYHDLGLIFGLLAPAHGGYPVTFMSPFSFLKRPVRWLRAVSEHRATLSGAPNFAYELCAARISEEDRAGLDLSTWRLALNGAEPVRPATLDRFADAFRASGFRREALYPAYGLAEATLVVSGGDRAAPPAVRRLAADALAEHRATEAAPGEDARPVTGCGAALDGQDVVIVDPAARLRLPEGRVGEIWVAGPSVAHGYWDRPGETEETFAARLADTGEGPFLRTGDLGFLDGTELHVTGRIKDVVIIAGRNHYPQDIERAAEDAHPALRPGCGVAGAREIGGEERLILVHEADSGPDGLDTDRVVTALRTTVAEEFGLQVHHIALVGRGRVPKTSSGKLQRAACLDSFLDGTLTTLATWNLTPLPGDTAGQEPQEREEPRDPAPAPGRSRVEEWLVRELSARLGVPAGELDPTLPVAAYGLRSAETVTLIGDLEQWLGRPLDTTVMWEYPTVELLARFLSGDGTPGHPAAPEAGEERATVRTPASATRSTGLPAGRPDTAEPVAIVGIGCRFPGGADGPEAFWDLLREGRDAITEVPADRWKVDEFFDSDPAVPGRTTTRWGGFLDGVDRFDPQFFGISPHEAARMDPQQRLLAEVAWEALEDAGVPAESLAGTPTGVFIGISTFDHAVGRLQDLEGIDAHTGTGSALSIAANRLSYLFDLRGPSMAVDTACSSSLVAVLQACASLARGECSVALAGGVNLILSPAFAINFSKAGVMSPDGRCKTFDASADGYVRSEGAGVVVLKPLSRALADRDPVYGVIRGGAVNQDGRSNGIMAPNPQAQEAVLRAAYADAGVRPQDVHYAEAHGTGTMIGDPIEAKALAAVLAEGRDAGEPCLIGSVKSNLGHMEAAAGIGGLIKAALMVRHRTVPASLHYHEPNPHIPFDEVALRVADSLRPWPSTEGPALVGVSSFGFGGTNAHVVVEEAPRRPADAPPASGDAYALAVSARTEEALRELAASHADRLTSPATAPTPRSLAFAAGVRRTHHEHRLAAVGSTLEDFRKSLLAFAEGEDAPGLSTGPRRVGRRPKPVFVFSGQGARWWPVAADLLATEPAFRAVLDRCDALLRKHVDWSLLAQLSAHQDDARLMDTDIGQPALCAVQIALATLWRSWGIEPAAVVGHSVGEVAAAHISGALGLEDALLVALHRGRVLRSAAGRGRMAMAGVPHERALRILAEREPGPVWVAASNSPGSTVFSGESAALEALARDLEAEGVFCRVLESVEFASHSPLMEPVAAELWQLLAELEPRATAIPMLSTVTGEPADGSRLDAEYWASNLTSPVLFDRAVTALADSGHDVFVEISPHPMLGEAVAERLAAQESDGVVVASLRRDTSGRFSLLDAVGRLYTAGHPVDWGRLYGRSGPMTALPTYPWQRQPCRVDDGPGRKRRPVPGGHPVLETHVRSAAPPGASYWSARVDLAGFPYLRDHRVGGAAVLPASLVLDAALTAARRTLGDERAVVEDVRFTRMTVVPEDADEATVQLVLFPESGDTGSFRLFSRDAREAGAQDWSEAAQGRYRIPARDTEDGDGRESAPPTLDEARERCSEPLEAAEHYALLDRAALQYGPAFQGIDEIHRRTGEAVAHLRDMDGQAAGRDPYAIHPALLDSCLQALAAAVGRAATYLPVAVERFTLASRHTAPRWAHAVTDAAEPGTDGTVTGRVLLFDGSGTPVGAVEGITLRPLDGAEDRDAVAEALLELRWHEAAEETDAPAADPAAGWWLVFADRAGAGEDLRARIEAAGGTCVTVTTGDGYRRPAENRYELDPSRREDFTALLDDLRAGRPAPAGVIHAWGLDAASGDDTDAPPGTLWTATDGGCLSALHLVQALTAPERDHTPRLVLVTRGAQRVRDEDAPPAVAQSPLWGLARVLRLEHAELRSTIVDLGPADDAAGLLAELLRPGAEEQLALRDGKRFVPRLETWTAPARDDQEDWRPHHFDPRADANYRILATRPGILDSLTPTLWTRDAPGPGQVEIEVAAAGLNFNDVLKAMDICPGVPSGSVPLGGECAGRVTAVGRGVDRFRVGDPVMAVATSSMAAYATTTSALVAPVPQGLDDAQAAALPVAFLTALYGLEYLAHLAEGEKVLIHSATGGVGLAALQVARRNGAEIYATAGTEEKRALLRDLGVRHVMDSRTLGFADEIRELTGGHGVDVVLNSIAGEALTRSLALLAPNGRFVEIGKQDIYDNNHLGLGFLKHNRSFFAVDLERSFAEQPRLIAHLFDELTRGFEAGDFTALPVTGFPYSRADAAFAHMAKARHTGKIVLRPDGTPPETVATRSDGPVRPDATYLITGGLGALGLRTARYLVDQGARHLVLAGRRGPSAEAERIVDGLRARQARIHVQAADVSRYEDVTALLDGIDASMPPLAGVVHAAGTLDDGLLSRLDGDRFRTVAEPKAAGAWHLHRATAGRELDFFVLYSSAASLIGSASQANYAAANAFLDALAQYRGARGLPALSVNWGPWAEAGLAARPDRGGALSTRGILSLSPQDGIEALGRLLRTPTVQAGVLPLDREKLRESAAGGLLPGLLAGLLDDAGTTAPDGGRPGSGIRAELLATAPGRRRRDLLVQHCRAEAGRVLRLEATDVDASAPLTSMGFDSLLSLELRKRLESSLRVALPATITWRYPTIDVLVPFLAERMDIALEAGPEAERAVTPTEAATEPPADDIESDLDELSDSDIEALLLAKTKQIDEGR
ncbi:SDR family NAD(P)-dependent oxidoreductase [Streptomyces albireticuli]|uniref:SDR family NAD(P)-dependent oxidoreductase n=1 Tax=Streptomyces albireticuli TaxID=1940 RepID=UPI0036772F4C